MKNGSSWNVRRRLSFFFPSAAIGRSLLTSNFPRILFFFSVRFNQYRLLLDLISIQMAFWREVGLQLRRVPKSANICLSQSRRHLSSRTWINTGVTTQPRTTARRSVQQWQGHNITRAFSVTSPTAHGHITPPKPGEEYASMNAFFVPRIC